MRRIAVAAIQDNKLFMVKKDGVWDLPTLSQGNWLTEERAIAGRIQKEIGAPVTILGRFGDFETEPRRKSDLKDLGVFICDIKGPIMIRNSDIAEWRYMTSADLGDSTVQDIVSKEVIPYLVHKRLLIWPQK